MTLAQSRNTTFMSRVIALSLLAASLWALAYADVAIDLSLPITRTMPQMNFDENTIDFSITAPFLDDTWAMQASPFSGGYGLAPFGCQTYAAAGIDIRQERYECGGLEKIKWTVYTSVPGKPDTCLGASQFEAAMTLRINAMHKSEADPESAFMDVYYEGYPRSIDVTSMLPSPSPHLLSFTQAVLNCPALDGQWGAFFEAHVFDRVSLLAEPFLYCNTTAPSRAYFLRSVRHYVPGETRKFIYHSGPWVPSESTWTANFKEHVALSLNYTDMPSFDAAMMAGTLTGLPIKESYREYMSLPDRTSQPCQVRDHRGMNYVAFGKLKVADTAPNVLSDVGTCDTLTLEPSPSPAQTYKDEVHYGPVPTSAQFWSISKSSSFPGFVHPLGAGSPVSAIVPFDQMFDGRMRHFLRYDIQTSFSTLRLCKGANGDPVLLNSTANDAKTHYEMTVDVVSVPDTGMAARPFAHYPVTYRFAIDHVGRVFTVSQVYDNAEDFDVQLIRAFSRACVDTLDPTGDWNVPFKVGFQMNIVIDRPAGKNIGVSAIVPTTDPMEVSSDMSPAGCYGFPAPGAVFSNPVCAEAYCTVEATVYSSCFYPDADGLTFFRRCPNVNCSESIYQSALGVYRLGVNLVACPDNISWSATDPACVAINPDNPRVVTFSDTPHVEPNPASRELPALVTGSVLRSEDPVESEGTTEFFVNGVPAVTYDQYDDMIMRLRLAPAIRPYMQLLVEQVDLCFGPTALIRQKLDNLGVAGFDCVTDTDLRALAMPERTVWLGASDSLNCSGPCFGDGDTAFKGRALWVSPLHEDKCGNMPGCDVGSLRIARLVSPHLLGSSIIQRQGAQTGATYVQVHYRIESLTPLQLHSSPKALRLKAFFRLSATGTVELDSGMIVRVTTEDDSDTARAFNIMVVVFGGMFMLLLVIGATSAIFSKTVTNQWCNAMEACGKCCRKGYKSLPQHDQVDAVRKN